MSTPRPHATSRDVSTEDIAALTKQSSLISSLFPNTPRFTVVVAAAFPHDSEDVENEFESFDSTPPILESYTLCVRAVNVHTAIDMALTQTVNMIREDYGNTDDLDFTLSVVGAFEGHLQDFSTSYDYRRSGIHDVEAAAEDYDMALDTYTG